MASCSHDSQGIPHCGPHRFAFRHFHGFCIHQIPRQNHRRKQPPCHLQGALTLAEHRLGIFPDHLHPRRGRWQDRSRLLSIVCAHCQICSISSDDVVPTHHDCLGRNIARGHLPHLADLRRQSSPWELGLANATGLHVSDDCLLYHFCTRPPAAAYRYSVCRGIRRSTLRTRRQ